MTHRNADIRRRSLVAAFALAAAATLAAACADSGLPYSDPFVPADSGRPTFGEDAGMRPDVEPTPPDVEEVPADLTTPVAGLTYLFVANTSNGTLAKVYVAGDAVQIESVRVGAEPTIVRTVPNSDTAVVLNEGSDTVSVVRAGPIGEGDDVTTLDVLPDTNTLLLTPSGEFAIAYYDHANADPGDAAGSLSEVAVVDLADGDEAVYQLSVGVNVRDILFDASGDTMFVVSDDGISSVPVDDLAQNQFSIPTPIDPFGEQPPLGVSRDVMVVDDGSFAVVRTAGVAALRIVDMLSGELVEIPVPSVPSDLDAIPGTHDVLVTFSVPDEVARISLVDTLREGRAVGRWPALGDNVNVRFSTVLADGHSAVVYGPSSGPGEIVILDLLRMQTTSYAVRKDIEYLVASPNGRFLIVVHDKRPGEPVAGESEEDIIAKSHGYTVIDLLTGATKLIRTSAMPSEIAFSEDGNRAFVLLSDRAQDVRDLSWIDLRTFQTFDHTFASFPEHVGVIGADEVVYVSQEHELGRIAFVDVDSGEVRELTGFELNSFVE